jgi:hypothetical protein
MSLRAVHKGATPKMLSIPWLRRAAGLVLLSAGSTTAAVAACAEVPVPPVASFSLPGALPATQQPVPAPPPAAPVADPTPPVPGKSGSASPAPNAPTAVQQPTVAPTPDYTLTKAEHQRILGIMPEFQAVNNGAGLPPLTPKEKFHLMWKSSTDPFIFSLDAIVAGIGQAKNSNPGFGQGAQGYFKRFGASYADTFDGNFWGNAVLTVAFREDPRYYREGESYGYLHRAGYSALTAIWTRGDSGKWGPNFANVIGNFISGGISNLYYPAADRGLGKTVTGAITVTAEGTIGSELIEFWPDIAHRLFRKRFRQQMGQQNTAGVGD